MNNTRSQRKVPWALYGFVVSVVAVLAAVHLSGEASEEGLQLFARHTARFSFGLFLLVFSAAPLAALTRWPAARALARSRRHLGLAFALAHFLHLGALTAYFVFTAEVAEPIAIIFGGLGYVLLAALSITSSDAMMARLGRNWKRLHTIGVYYLWFIFTQSYAGRVFAADSETLNTGSPSIIYVGLLVLAVFALLLRLAKRWIRR